MRRILATAALSVILAGGAAVTSTPGATADPVPQAATCTGVWVVVDYGSLGGITTGCATSYANGLAALRSAGFNPAISAGFVDQINGKPGKPDSAKAYWSYWHATQDNDGSYGSWDYSALGAGGYRPAKGKAEGWRYQSLEDGKVAPGAKPPTDPGTPTPTPTPTKTASKPPKPTATPTATRKPTTAKPTTAASGTRAATTRASASTMASASATSSASTYNTTPSADSTPSPSEAGPSESPALADGPVEARAEPSSAPDPGTPTGLIVTGGLVVVAGAGLGGWWWLRGRKP